MTSTTIDRPALTPFFAIGGSPTVRRFVDRFYDLIDSEPDFSALRALHGPDLGPMRTSLASFLTAWLGGPRDWFDERPGACIMSAHAKVAVTAETVAQWTTAMSRAMADAGITPGVRAQIDAAFARMAQGMASR